MRNIIMHVDTAALDSSFSKYSIQAPKPSQMKNLRQLWKDTFGDTDAFLDMFFETAFSYDRCLCATIEDSVVAALYWFNCEFSGEKIAYIYAVATAKEFRGQGICHNLMEHTHLHLKEKGYAGTILSPAEDSLFHFYQKMGYETTAYKKEIHYEHTNNELKTVFHDTPISCKMENLQIRKITKTEFAKLHRSFLPKTAVLQENENLDFLERQACFYTGNDFLLTAQIVNAEKSDAGTPKKHLHGIEFLGNPSTIPAIVHAFACTSGTFRTIGRDKPFGMYYAFTKASQKPDYLSFIFD